jgi:hypothetical protein
MGTIRSSGPYSPPAIGGTHTVTATGVALSSSSDWAQIAVSDLRCVFTHHNDLARDEANTPEHALTCSAVNPATFGKLSSCALDGAV